MTKVVGLLACLSLAATVPQAFAGSTSVGGSVTFDQRAKDVGVPHDVKVLLQGAHTFDNGAILGGSVEYLNNAFIDTATVNLEATLGYRIHFNPTLSVIGSLGFGEHFTTSGAGPDFPYYVLRAGADVALNKVLTWNAVSFRYRDAFEEEDNFKTPQLGTGVTYKLDGHNSVSGAVQYNWRDWSPESVGFVIGYSHNF